MGGGVRRERSWLDCGDAYLLARLLLRCRRDLGLGRGDRSWQGVGKTLLHAQVNEADAAGMWTPQTAIFPENRASLALHHSAEYRTLAVRSRIAQLDGQWRDTVLLERRNDLN